MLLVAADANCDRVCAAAASSLQAGHGNFKMTARSESCIARRDSARRNHLCRLAVVVRLKLLPTTRLSSRAAMLLASSAAADVGAVLSKCIGRLSSRAAMDSMVMETVHGRGKAAEG